MNVDKPLLDYEKGPEEKRLWETIYDRLEKEKFHDALFLLRKLSKKGDVVAFLGIAKIYEFGGGGVNRDFEKARKWYEFITDEVYYSHAHLGLGRLYHNGYQIGKNYHLALHHFSLASEEDLPGAYFALGWMLHHGQGVDGDLEQAIKYYELAYSRDHVYAYYCCGICHIRLRHYMTGVKMSCKGLYLTVKTYLKDPKDNRLYMT